MRIYLCCMWLLFLFPGALAADDSRGATRAISKVETLRVPGGGLQPQVALGKDGSLHMIYFRGKPGAGDIYYVHSKDEGATFSAALRVNSQEGSAVAKGTIRGAQISIGGGSRVHVAWNGSGKARPRGLPNPELPDDSPYKYSAPMLYTRMNDDGTGFEPQRNLMISTYALDGGGSVAADEKGNVYVTWHAPEAGAPKGEAGRAVWVAKSKDAGATFAPEARANREPTGACGCCGLRTFVDRQGNFYVLYRTATAVLNRDMFLLVSRNKARDFDGARVHPWRIPKCVMSSASFFEGSGEIFAAWETEEQVYFSRVKNARAAISSPIRAPGLGARRKHPTLASNGKGQVILVWTEGTSWNKGGSVAWQVFDGSGKLIPGQAGRKEGVPAWGLVAVFPVKDGGFTVVY